MSEYYNNKKKTKNHKHYARLGLFNFIIKINIHMDLFHIWVIAVIHVLYQIWDQNIIAYINTMKICFGIKQIKNI